MSKGGTLHGDARDRVSRRLLVIEDDFVLRASLSELLIQEGFEVSCAADGAEGLSRLEREPLPAAIVLDVVLPRMSGLSFRQEQLRSPAFRDIPTIAYTALRNEAELGSLGFHAVISKPASFDRLCQILSSICPA
jgi:CheY-like chemotaxis protein